VKPECVRNFSSLIDFQPAEGQAQWRDKIKVLYSALLVCWKISIDYEAIDEGCLQNPVIK
jgi:hypothetical protein